MDSAKTKRRTIKSNDTSSGDRRAGSVGERPELARAGGKDSSEASTTPPSRKRSNATEAAEA
jgi:hypothetical protein